MKITEEKIRANGENSKLGGVKATEGKEISKMNALKHGILSNVLWEVEELEVDAMLDRLCEEFEATTLYQQMLIEELISTYVRIARCAKIQKQVTTEDRHTVSKSNLAFISSFSSTVEEGYAATHRERHIAQFELIITRYEPQLVNRMIRIISELRKLQEGV